MMMIQNTGEIEKEHWFCSLIEPMMF